MFRPPESKPTTLCGISFKNIIGLGAGFDKNAIYLRELSALGFGFIEVGTVTPVEQAGNDKPRLFRLPKDKAIINRMGFNNDGMEVIAERLKRWRKTKTDVVIGANIGKNKNTSNEDAWKDYEKCFLALHSYVDYITVNVSSPNTPGLRDLQQYDSLKKILSTLIRLNDNLDVQTPLFLKLSPDLNKEDLDQILHLCLQVKLDGIIFSNTSIARTGLETDLTITAAIGAGGLSGKPLMKASTYLLDYVKEKTQGNILLIASGGIFTADDVRKKQAAGASLVQVWTGFIYEGPAIVKKILRNLN